MPVYSVNGNLMINLEHLSNYGYYVIIEDDHATCTRISTKLVTGVQNSEWNRTYKNRVTIKPTYYCLINNREVPVLLIDNKPFIFLNELYYDNTVSVLNKVVKITLSDVDGIEKMQQYSDQLEMRIRVLKEDFKIVDYIANYIYFDPATKRVYLKSSTDISEMYSDISDNKYTLLYFDIPFCNYYDDDYNKDFYIFEDAPSLEKYYQSSDYINKKKFIFALYQKENKNSPVYVVKSSVELNSIGIPEASIDIFNFSLTPIDALELYFDCFDTFGNPAVNLKGTNRFNGIMQHDYIPAISHQTFKWSLTNYQMTSKIKNVTLTKAHFTNDTIWLNNFGSTPKSY